MGKGGGLGTETENGKGQAILVASFRATFSFGGDERSRHTNSHISNFRFKKIKVFIAAHFRNYGMRAHGGAEE